MSKLAVKKFLTVYETEQSYKYINSCYLGVSIRNPYIMSKKLQLILEWIDSNFTEKVILIGDYLYRINEFITFGKSQYDASEMSLTLGTIIAQQIQAQMSPKLKSNFQVIHWKDFMENNPSYNIDLEYINSFFKNNSKFQRSIEEVSNAYISKQMSKGGIYLNKEEAIIKSNEFLIEEMAIFTTLSKQGFRNHIYPGEVLKVLKEINRGDYNDFISDLRYVNYFELNVK